MTHLPIVALAINASLSPKPFQVASAQSRGRTEGLIAGAFEREADPFGAWCDNDDLPPGTWPAFRAAYLEAHRAFLVGEAAKTTTTDVDLRGAVVV